MDSCQNAQQHHSRRSSLNNESLRCIKKYHRSVLRMTYQHSGDPSSIGHHLQTPHQAISLASRAELAQLCLQRSFRNLRLPVMDAVYPYESIRVSYPVHYVRPSRNAGARLSYGAAPTRQISKERNTHRRTKPSCFCDPVFVEIKYNRSPQPGSRHPNVTPAVHLNFKL